jgi:SPP1 gp7 family putative phage head morphogenesis protein
MLLERLGIPPIFFLYNSSKYTGRMVDDLKAVVQNLQAATSGVLPRQNKDDLDFWAPELADQATSVFIPALNMFNKDIARAILMPGLLGATPDDQQKGGSYARAKKHFDVFMLVVERLRKRLECLVMKEQVIKQLVDLNFTGGEYPIFKFLPLDDEVQVELLTAWGSLTGQRIVTPQGEDETHIRELMKFPELQKEPISDQPPPVNPNPQDPNADPNAQDNQGNQSYGLTRRPNKYERQVNFAQVETTLDKVEAQAIENVKSALTASKAKLIARVQKSFTGNPRFATDLSLNGFGDVQAAIKEFLRSAYQEGSKALRQEFKSKNFADPMFAPIEALRYLDQKTIWITGVLRDKITADAKLIILNAIKFGESLTATVQKLDELFVQYIGDEQVLQDGEALNPYRLETIIRTNSTEAYNQGRLIQARDPEFDGLIKYMEYSAIIDSRTTPICRLLDGKIIPLNDPNMDRLAPSNHFNCRSILVAVPLSQQVNALDILTDAEEGEALGLIPVGFSAQEKESRPAKIFRGEPEKEKEPTIKVDVHMPEQQPPIVHVHIDKSATVKEVMERDKDGLIKTWVERPLENENE